MANLTVRRLDDEVHRLLRLRAAEHGRSVESEVRAILSDAVQPKVGGRGASVVARLAGRGDVPMSTDDILALTRADD